MSTTSPLTSTASTASTSPLSSAAGSADLGRDEFLQLLVAQLRNQDPTSPQGGHEFVAQLAQFSSVEQLSNISGTLGRQSGQLAALSERLDGLRAGQSALSGELSGRIDLQSATALIGRSVDVQTDHVGLGESGSAPIQVRLGGAAREVELTIRDADGEVVRTIRTDARSAGDHTIQWDGADADGERAPAGDYTVEVNAIGTGGGTVSAAAVTSGTVDRVTVESGEVLIWVGGQPIPFENLLAIRPDGSAPDVPTEDRPIASTTFLPMP